MIAVGDQVTVVQPDGVTRCGVITSAVPQRPGFWVVDIASDSGDRVLTLHHESKITKETQ